MTIPILKDIRFVNVGEDPLRPKPGWVSRRQWNACIKYCFLSAGQALTYNQPLLNLQIDDIVAAFITGRGYVGIGVVENTAIDIKDFSFNGKKLKNLDIDKRYITGTLVDTETVDTLPYLRKTIFCNANNEKTEYAVRIKWKETVFKEEAYWKKNAGLFANPSIQSNLKNQQKTIDFLQQKFGVNFK
jgi:uncharacterized protein